MTTIHLHWNWLVAQIPQCTSRTSYNAPFCNRNVHVCTFLLKKWCIVGHLSDALWDLWDGSFNFCSRVTFLYGQLLHNTLWYHMIWSVFSKFLPIDTTQVAGEVEVWSVFCEFKLWFTFCLNRCSVVCSIRILWIFYFYFLRILWIVL